MARRVSQLRENDPENDGALVLDGYSRMSKPVTSKSQSER